MKRLCFALTLLVFVLMTPCAQAAPYYPGTAWESVSPEKAGFEPAGLEALKSHKALASSIGGMVLYDGKIVFQWGDITRKGRLHSVRKSFMSALYGIYREDGKLNLDRTLAQLGIDDTNGLTDTEKQATVRQLLQARSGVYHGAAYETAGMKKLRPQRGSHAPGTFWYYNNWDFNALGAIFEQQTGVSVPKAFYERIALPTGMQDFRPERDFEYRYDSDSRYPAYLFAMTARDMARFGLLFLREGRWEDKQLVPSAWVRESTQAYSTARGYADYGYLWWIAKNREWYQAQGNGGQFIIVAPKYKLVVVNLSDFSQTRVNSNTAFRDFFKELLGSIKK